MRRRLRPWDESPVILAPKAHEFLWPLKHQSLTEYVSAQSPGVSVPDVIDPPFDGSVKFSERDFACTVFRPAFFQFAREFDDVAGFDAAMRWIDAPQPADGGGNRALVGRLDEQVIAPVGAECL